MADNVEAASQSGGAVFAADDIASVYYPRTKLIHGADGVNDGDVSTANPLPVDIREIAGASVVVGGGVEAAALRVTIASDSTGVLSVDDNGGALTVDNGGTFAVQVDGAALTALQLIDDIVNTVDGAGGAAPVGVAALATRDDALSALTPIEGDFVQLRVDANGALWVIPSGTVAISAASLPLPSGAATAANQSTANTALAAIQTAVEVIDNAISGSEMQVDVVGALPAGTNAIGKLAANSGVDIGDVDVTSVIPGTGATNLGKAEDGAHTTGDVGVMALAVRKDADGAFGADLDYSPLQLDDNGFLKVNIKAGAGSGGTASTDDGAFTAGSGSGTPAMGFFSADTVDAGDVGVLAMDANRRLMVSIEVDNVGIGGGTQYAVDAALGATPTGTLAIAIRDDALSALTPVEGDAIGLRVNSTGALWVHSADLSTLAGAVGGTEMQVDVVAALPAGTNNIGDVDVLTVPADPFGANADAASATGSISAKLRFIASTGIPITGTVTVGSHAVTNAGTFAVQVDGNALTALQLIDDAVFTDDAAFTPGTSKGFAVGFQADETSPDSVDEGDFGVARMTLDRQVRVTLGPNAVLGATIFRSIDLDESEEEIKATAGNLYGYYFANLHATSVRYLKFYNATAANVTVGTTTPVLTLPLPAASSGHISFGVPVRFDTAITAAATTGVADNDTGAPGANEVVLNAFYN